MLVLSREEVCALASLPRLIEALEVAFRTEWVAPARQVVSMPGGLGGRSFLSMPAFDSKGAAAIKLVTYSPDNPARGLPTVQAAIIVFSETGAPTAIVDGTIVTQLRTGATSALASRYLSRADSTHLVIMGTGALAPHMAAAHCTIRPITQISVWGRRPDRAAATAEAIRLVVHSNVEILVPNQIDTAVASADIISCSTSSPTPVLAGKWLKPGAFVDLVGSFSPFKREADDDVVSRSRIFVDTFEGALREAGDILDPLNRGIIDRRQVLGELSDLVCGRVAGRNDDREITLFKSVGTAIADFVASQLVVVAASRNQLL